MTALSVLSPEWKKLWVAALRSGNYLQGRGQLKHVSDDDTTATYCCLGVLQEIMGKEACPGMGSSEYLSGTVLPNSMQERLAAMNDGSLGYAKSTFLEIADYIEANL